MKTSSANPGADWPSDRWPVRAETYSTCEQWLRRAEVLSEQAGSRLSVAKCRHERGENHRAAGRPAAAESHYAGALEICEALGSRHQVLCRIKLALCLLQSGRPARARIALERGLQECEAQGLRNIGPAGRIFLLPCFVTDGDWESWEYPLKKKH